MDFLEALVMAQPNNFSPVLKKWGLNEIKKIRHFTVIQAPFRFAEADESTAGVWGCFKKFNEKALSSWRKIRTFMIGDKSEAGVIL